MTDLPAHVLAERLGTLLSARGWQVATAESCTGGRIAAEITAVAGSSVWFECGIVSYANSTKHHILNVKEQTLTQQGAVSEAVVREMVSGVRALARAHLGVSVSGIAGPAGGSPEKPVGTVWFAWESPKGARVSRQLFEGDRAAIQNAATLFALQGLVELLESE